jgi:hypothetical protein
MLNKHNKQNQRYFRLKKREREIERETKFKEKKNL